MRTCYIKDNEIVLSLEPKQFLYLILLQWWCKKTYIIFGDTCSSLKHEQFVSKWDTPGHKISYEIKHMLCMLLIYHASCKNTYTKISFLPSGCCNLLRNSSTSSLGSPHDGGTLDSQSRWHLYLHSLHFKPETIKRIFFFFQRHLFPVPMGHLTTKVHQILKRI